MIKVAKGKRLLSRELIHLLIQYRQRAPSAPPKHTNSMFIDPPPFFLLTAYQLIGSLTMQEQAHPRC
jgi:hypothetical protein